jgi:hypothetical protein
MNINVEIKPDPNKGNDYRNLFINGVNLGTWERSQLRHLIEVIDNDI